MDRSDALKKVSRSVRDQLLDLRLRRAVAEVPNEALAEALPVRLRADEIEEKLPLKTVVAIVLGAFAAMLGIALVAFLLYKLSAPLEKR